MLGNVEDAVPLPPREFLQTDSPCSLPELQTISVHDGFSNN